MYGDIPRNEWPTVARDITAERQAEARKARKAEFGAILPAAEAALGLAKAKARLIELEALIPVLKAREVATMENRRPQIRGAEAEIVRLKALIAEAETEQTAGAEPCEALTVAAYNNARPAAETGATKEQGRREKMLLVLPFNPDSEAAWNSLRKFESALAEAFGGFTVADGSGAWINGAGAYLKEANKIYSVSYIPEADHASRRRFLHLAYRVGAELDQIWLHIERSVISAEHRKVKR